mgnify:CR=1 FL=1
MELKFKTYAGYCSSSLAFNRTAYGIEIPENYGATLL